MFVVGGWTRYEHDGPVASALSYSAAAGLTWSPLDESFTRIDDVAYGAGQFVAVGETQCLRSPDGAAWTDCEVLGAVFLGVDAVGEELVLIASDGLRTSSDGQIWSDPIVSPVGARIIATVDGSHDKTPPHELGKLVWPRVEEHLRRAAQARLGELDAAQSGNRLASGVVQAWRAAAEGRGAHLVVDQGYHAPGVLDESGLGLTLVDDATAPGVIDDVVDELIELVLAKGGEVTFVDGGLDAHQHVALMLRY